MNSTALLSGGRGRRFVMSTAVVALVCLLAACSTPKKSPSLPALSTTGTVAAQATQLATESPSPTATPDNAPLAEFSMPKFNVSGKIVVKGVDPATNIMQSPDNKDDVAYYDFTPKPGTGCQSQSQCANTVLAGHVDWYTGQVGVFWHAKDLKEGDEIDLKLADGKVYKYKVVSNDVYQAEDAPVQQILGNTTQESITMITCDGVFNKSLQEYNARRVVRAVRES